MDMSASGSSQNVCVVDSAITDDSLTKIHFKDECHNQYYDAIRSGNVESLKILTNRRSDDISSWELEDLLAGTYEELKLKNVPLTEEMEFYVASELLDLRFSENNSERENIPSTTDDTKDRSAIVIENINMIVKEYSSNKRSTEKFLIICKFLAKNIHILKQKLKCTYDRLPWEEIEFCLFAYVNGKISNNEISYFFQSVLTERKMITYLENFSESLKAVYDTILSSKLMTKPSSFKRNDNKKNIIRERPAFEKLYIDYEKVRDIYSLETMKHYTDLALEVDYQTQNGQLVLIRTLQVIGENMKDTVESPKLSTSTVKLVLKFIDSNVRDSSNNLRALLSNTHSFTVRRHFENNVDAEYFSQIQTDIKQINIAIFEALVYNKSRIIESNLIEISESETGDKMKEKMQLLDTNKMFEHTDGKFGHVKYKKLEVLVGELNKIISYITDDEEKLMENIRTAIYNRNKEFHNIETHYIWAVKSLTEFAEITNSTYDINVNTIRAIRNLAKKLLSKFNPKTESQNFRDTIVASTLNLRNSVKERTRENFPNELNQIICEINHDVYFETENIKRVGEIQDKLKLDKDITNDYQNQKHFRDKLSLLKNFITSNNLNGSFAELFPNFKTNRQFETIIEMLLLDILEPLSSEEKLCDDILYLEDYSSLLMGKELRNHLAHGNFINNLSTFQNNVLLILTARKFIRENCNRDDIKNDGTGLKTSTSLQQKLENRLATVSNQQKMFLSITNGNVEQFNLHISEGADIFGRSYDMRTALHYAAKGSNLEFVKFLINKKISIDDKDIYGRTPLHIACLSGSNAIVKYLIEKYSTDINDADSSGKTALHLAAQNGHNETVQILLKNKASTNIKDVSGSSALHSAIRNNYKDVAVNLMQIEKNVDSNKARGGFTSLYLAAKFGHVELLNSLLEYKANVNARADNGTVPLHVAALNDNVEIVKILISRGACIKAKCIHGRTALHNAAENGNTEVLKVLLDNGANIDVIDDTLSTLCTSYSNDPRFSFLPSCSALKHTLQNNRHCTQTIFQGQTPLHLGADNGHFDVVRILIEKKCNIEIKSQTGFTALHYCVQGGHVNIINILLSKKANIEALDNNNRTPLHIAAASDSISALETLISNGANKNAIDKYGKSVLHLACENARRGLVKLLIDNNAEVNFLDKHKMTPLHTAVIGNTNEVVKILIEREADIHATENYGRTPLHLAVERGEIGIVQTLLENNADIEAECECGYTAIHVAVIHGRREIVEVLIGKDAKINLPDKQGDTPLFHATRKKDIEMCRVLIKNNSDINYENGQRSVISLAVETGFKEMVDALLKHKNVKIDQNNNLLHVAALRGHKSIVELLLKYDSFIHVNAISNTENVTPLHLAVTNGHTEVVELLLSNSADVNISSDNETPLHIAATRGFSKIVRHLLQKGAHTYVKNIKEKTPIELAIRNAHKEIVDLLLPYESNKFVFLHTALREGGLKIFKHLEKILHQHNELIFTIFHSAVSGCQTEIIEYFIQKKIDVNIYDYECLFAIHVACSNNLLKMVRLLLNNGAYYDVEDYYDRRPWDFTTDEDILGLLEKTKQFLDAVKQKDLLTIENLLNDGACINANSLPLGTALHIAARGGDIHVVSLLLERNANPNISDASRRFPLYYAIELGNNYIVKALLSKGAIYKGYYLTLDRSVNRKVINQIKLIDELFSDVRSANTKVINYLNSITDIIKLKAVMNARNKRNESLIVFAILFNFPEIDELKNIGQTNISSDMCRAHALFQNEKYQEAHEAFSKILEKRLKIFNSDNPAVLDIKINLGEILCQLQKYEEAFELFMDIYKKQKNIFSENKKYTLSTRSKLAYLLHKRGKNDEALEMYRKVFYYQNKILGTANPDTVKTHTNMANVLCELGRYEEALDIYDEKSKILQKSLGTITSDDHLVLSIRYGIAAVLHNQGKYKEAFSIYESVYEKRKIILGPSHMETLDAANNIVSVRLLDRKNEKAMGAYKQLLEVAKNTLKSNNINALAIQNDVAQACFNEDILIEAYEVMTEILRQREIILNTNHPHNKVVVECLNSLFNFDNINYTTFIGYCKNRFTKAVNNGDEQLLQNLLDRGFDVNTKDEYGRIQLFYAVRDGCKRIVELLLNNGADVTAVTVKENTILHAAASKENKEILDILLRRLKFVFGCNCNNFIDAKTSGTGSTSLHVAAKIGSIEIVKSLLEYGATYNPLDYNRRTPIDVTNDINIKHLLKLIEKLFKKVKRGDEKVVQELKNLNSDECRCILNTRDDCGKTLLRRALIDGHQNIASKIEDILKY